VNIGAAGADVSITGGSVTCKDLNKSERYGALFLNAEAADATIVATGVSFDIMGDSPQAVIKQLIKTPRWFHRGVFPIKREPAWQALFFYDYFFALGLRILFS